MSKTAQETVQEITSEIMNFHTAIENNDLAKVQEMKWYQGIGQFSSQVKDKL